MINRDEPSVSLPTHQEATRLVDQGAASALDQFVYAHEPEGRAETDAFRRELVAVLEEAEGRCHLQGLYARLRGRCPFCDGSDVAGPVESADVERGRPGERIRVPVVCENCGRTWFDVYDLLRVETAAGVDEQ